MYNNNETPIVYEDKADSSIESSKQKNEESITLTCENGAWRPATDAEREEMQRRIDEFDEIMGQLSENAYKVFIAQSKRMD